MFSVSCDRERPQPQFPLVDVRFKCTERKLVVPEDDDVHLREELASAVGEARSDEPSLSRD